MCNIPAAGPRVSRPARHRSARRRVSGFDPKKTYPQARPRPSGSGRGNQHHAKGLTLKERTERGRGDAVEESEAPPRDGDAREDDGHAKGPDLADAAGAASVVDPGSRSSDQSPDRLLIQHLVSWGAVRMRRAAPHHHSSPDPHVSAAHRGPAALGTCGAQKQRSEVVGERRPVGGTAPCPPPAARRPVGHDRDDHLGHGADEALDLQDVQAFGPSGVDARSSVGHVRRVVVAGCGGGRSADGGLRWRRIGRCSRVGWIPVRQVAGVLPDRHRGRGQPSPPRLGLGRRAGRRAPAHHADNPGH